MKKLISYFFMFFVLLVTAGSALAHAGKHQPSAHLLFVEKSPTGQISALKEKDAFSIRLDRPGEINWFTDAPYHAYGSWTPEKFVHITHTHPFLKKHPNFAVVYDQTKSGEKQVEFLKITAIRYETKPQKALYLTGVRLANKSVSTMKAGKIYDVSVFIDSLCIDTICFG